MSAILYAVAVGACALLAIVIFFLAVGWIGHRMLERDDE